MAVFLFKSVHQPKYLTMEFKVEQEEGMETNFALKQAFKLRETQALGTHL